MIRFENVTYRYGDGEGGISNVNLRVEKGELLAVIGPSGSGKSTLLKLLAGFMEPQSGSIWIDGKDVSGVAARHRDLGIVFQSYALFPHMTVLENVAYPLRLRGVDQAERFDRASKALGEVGLSSATDRLPATLSGGQQQRVALARALVYQPKALLLDEPLSALDASLRTEMRDLITHVQRTAQIATIHVTHDQEEALSMADRIAVVHRGEILQVASPKDLYDKPFNATVAAFVGKANLWIGDVMSSTCVRTEFGDIACDASDWGIGDRVNVMVRPEAIMPLTDDQNPEQASNCFNGTLVQDRFLGAVRRYDLSVAGCVITGETGYRGSLSRISIPSDSVRLLPLQDD
tara:strand:+ start:1030 stop:2073 length:1044 start_codon:yes stop_codon:yes gene_type:complete